MRRRSEIRLVGDYAEVELTQRQWAKIDIENIELIKHYTWCASKSKGKFYPCTTVPKDGKWTKLIMHRLILDAQSGEYCDHINGITLDNREEI